MTRTRALLPLTLIATTLAAAPALAGGYVPPVVESPVVAPVQETAQQPAWQGGYLGLTVGRACCGDDEVGVGILNDETLDSPNTLKLEGSNFGVRAGYRWQRGILGRAGVVGLELGYEKGDIADDFTYAGYEASDEVQGVLALRAKAGVLNAAQTTLFYGIAGLARGEFDYRVNGTGAGGPIAVDTTFKASGYVIGLGVEHKLTDRLSLTGEWEYANFGKTHLEDAAGKSTEATPDWHNLRLGVNFQF